MQHSGYQSTAPLRHSQHRNTMPTRHTAASRHSQRSVFHHDDTPNPRTTHNSTYGGGGGGDMNRHTRITGPPLLGDDMVGGRLTGGMGGGMGGTYGMNNSYGVNNTYAMGHGGMDDDMGPVAKGHTKLYSSSLYSAPTPWLERLVWFLIGGAIVAITLFWIQDNVKQHEEKDLVIENLRAQMSVLQFEVTQRHSAQNMDMDNAGGGGGDDNAQALSSQHTNTNTNINSTTPSTQTRSQSQSDASAAPAVATPSAVSTVPTSSTPTPAQHTPYTNSATYEYGYANKRYGEFTDSNERKRQCRGTSTARDV